MIIIPRIIATTTGELTLICGKQFRIPTTNHETFASLVNQIIVATGKNVKMLYRDVFTRFVQNEDGGIPIEGQGVIILGGAYFALSFLLGVVISNSVIAVYEMVFVRGCYFIFLKF